MSNGSISSLTIQAFLNEIKNTKKKYINSGILLIPDIFSGKYQNELLEHRKAKETIVSKLKDIFSTEWVTVEGGIIKKERLESFLLKKDIPPVEGYANSRYIPIVRIHKNSVSKNVRNDGSPTPNITEKGSLQEQLKAMIPQIVETVTNNLEKNGKVNSKIRIPGIDPDIVFDVNAFRNFSKEIRPVIRSLNDALELEKRKDIIGSIDYYIRRDDGGILKIDIIKNRSHDIFNHAFKSRLKSIGMDGHKKLKAEIQQKRDAFLEYQKNFFKKSESLILEDDFFLGRSKPERKVEQIEICPDISSLMDEFPELKKEFYDTFVEKFFIILNSNNITKNDLNLDIRYFDNAEGADRIEIDFKSIENFRITRGIRKYNGIATNLPLEEEEHEAFEEAIAAKNKLVDETEKISEIGGIPQLKRIIAKLDELKKSFPMLTIDQYRDIQLKLETLERKKRQQEEEERRYAEAVSTIESILADPSKMEYEFFHFSIEKDDGMEAGLKGTKQYQGIERGSFVRRLAEIVAKTPPTSLSDIRDYDDFDPAKTEETLTAVLYESFINNAVLEVCEEKQDKLRKTLESNPALKTNIQTLSKEYATTYKSTFADAYAERFFMITAEIASPRAIPSIVSQMINGTQKYRPIFETETGHVTHRADQVMMRVKEASKRKKENVSNWHEKVQHVENKLLKIEFEDKAYNGASNMKPEAIRAIPAMKVLEVMVNKDGKFSNEKRIFSWLTIEKIDLILNTLNKAVASKNMENKKASLNGAIHFFESLKATNTKELLDAKINAHTAHMERYTRELEQVTHKYQEEASRPLEEYDSDLKKMKKAFLRNFCQPRA